MKLQVDLVELVVGIALNGESFTSVGPRKNRAILAAEKSIPENFLLCAVLSPKRAQYVGAFVPCALNVS